ncbi:transposase [Pseudonocardia sp.]|uniref:transposase n=1 Tax=Pseudonocardia sp. TaxID=60912 RepID=UPI0039C96756
MGSSSSGYDAGKKTKGRKRNIATDTLGLLLIVTVTAASVQDRDGAHRLLALLRERFSTISLVWADGGYAGRLITWATAALRLSDHHQTHRQCRRVRRAAPPVSGGAHLRMADPPPATGPRLRATTRPPRSHGVVGQRRHHDPPPDPRTRRPATPTTLGPTPTNPTHRRMISPPTGSKISGPDYLPYAACRN